MPSSDHDVFCESEKMFSVLIFISSRPVFYLEMGCLTYFKVTFRFIVSFEMC